MAGRTSDRHTKMPAPDEGPAQSTMEASRFLHFRFDHRSQATSEHRCGFILLLSAAKQVPRPTVQYLFRNASMSTKNGDGQADIECASKRVISAPSSSLLFGGPR